MVCATAYRSILITICLLLGLTTLVLLLAHAASAQPGERRVALVIGNSQYHHVARLANPTNDARLIAETLTSVGFTLVGGKAQLDLDKTAFDRMVQEFSTAIQGAVVALFYYAGHGVQVRGANYLAPVSANPTREADIDFQLLNVDLVLRQMELAGTRLNFLILDACRNNPFAGRGLRTAGGGLAQIPAPEGTLISYATQPGNVALDGTDGHSPYTRALANAFRKPGLDVFAVFNETGLEVKKRTGGAQQPWVASSPIAGQFFFAGIPTQPPPASTGGNADAVEIAFWNSVKDTQNPDAVQTYLQQYPQGKFARLATLKLKQLTEPPKPGPQVAVGVSPQQPQTPLAPPMTQSSAVQERLGLRVEAITPELARSLRLDNTKGVVVSRVAPDSPAAEAGIQQGDIVREVNRQPAADIESYGAAISNLTPNRPALFLLERRGNSLYVALKPE